MVFTVSENLSLFVLICIVSLLLHARASTQYIQREEHSSLDSDHGQLEKSLDPNYKQGASVFNVDTYGARGDGLSDDSKAFWAAWTEACTSSSPSVFLVPQRRKYLVKPINFKGPCNAPGLTFLISGTVVAPQDPWNLQDQTSWLQFSYLQGITVQGGGIIDGSGQKWWAYKSQGSLNEAPVAMTLNFCINVILRDLMFQNSPGVHTKLFSSRDVEVDNLQINAPENSPNTDGINVAGSQHVVIRNSKIGTGDDCVSIITGSSDIQINGILCGPGHGISIGSLGKDKARDTVSNVVVRGAYMAGTTNGLRIKTWQGGSGYAQYISYEDVIMHNVANPIIIDQYYCSPSRDCKNQTSAVQVGNVSYKGIRGTSTTEEAIRIACSTTVPCRNIVMEDINLGMNEGTLSTSFVNSVKGVRLHGRVNPHF